MGAEPKTYLVEIYLPAADTARVDGTLARAEAAAEELARGGADLRFVRSTYIPDDETCFLVYEAGSAELARAACIRAGIPSDRVLSAIERPDAMQRAKGGSS